MKRYLTVLSLFWTTSLAAEMEYRANFVIATISSVGQLIANIFVLFLFYRANYQFNNWSWHQAMLVLGAFTLLQGYSEVFLAPNLSRIVRHVQNGTLDFVLLKPIDTQFFLSTRNFSPWGLPDILAGVGLIAYGGAQLDLHALDYLRGAPLLLTGMLILYGIWFLMGCTTVWFVKIYNITHFLQALLEAGRYPIAAFPPAFRFLFTFIMPVAFMTTVPAQAMLGRMSTSWLLGSASLTLALLLAGRLFFRFAMRFYTSASS